MVKEGNPMVGYPYQAPISSLSAISCSFMILLSFLYKERLYNNNDTKLVIILLIFYNGLCLSSLLPVFKYSTNDNYISSNCTVSSSPDLEDNTDAICNLQGFLIQFFSLSGIIWTGYINYVNYKRIISNNNEDILNYKKVLFCVIIFGLITSAVPLAHVGYQESTCWCWFNISQSKTDLDHLKRFYWVGFFYAISWLIIIFILFAFIKTWVVYKRMGADGNRYKETMFIPIILFICFIPLTISRSIAITGMGGCELLGFSIFSSCLMRSLGFWNSLVYGFHSDIRKIFYEAYRVDNNYSEIKPPESASSNLNTSK